MQDINTVAGSLEIEYQTQISIMREYLQKIKDTSLYLVANFADTVAALKLARDEMTVFQNQYLQFRDTLQSNLQIVFINNEINEGDYVCGVSNSQE